LENNMTSVTGRIGTYDYRVVTEFISEAYDLSLTSLKYLYNMHTELQKANVNTDATRRIDLDHCIVKSYALIITEHFNNARTIFDAIRSLNDHILTQYGSVYGYQTIDQFLIDQYISVPLTYAVLSESIGYPITIVGDSKGRFGDLYNLLGRYRFGVSIHRLG
jgi:hypothetical protein